MLVTALGEDKANGLIDRILLGGNTTGLDTLKWMEARSVADIIRNEHPQIQAIVLAYLEADQSAEILTYFPEKVRLDVMMRVAALDSVQPSALQELNNILEKQFSGAAGSQTKQMGGYKTAAEIMNNLDSSIEGELMNAIKEIDEDLGTQIADLMFVFDNLKDVDDRGIQALLREVSSEVLILALKGADEDLRENFQNMSKRAAELMRDDLETKGPVKISEVEGAKEILTIARRMADAGEINLGGSGETMGVAMAPVCVLFLFANRGLLSRCSYMSKLPGRIPFEDVEKFRNWAVPKVSGQVLASAEREAKRRRWPTCPSKITRQWKKSPPSR